MNDQTLFIFFSKFAIAIADLSGKPATFVPAVLLVIVLGSVLLLFGDVAGRHQHQHDHHLFLTGST